ncbi:MAG: hypothetical protein ACOX7N_04440 [Lawsonibacter sp.]|jgi:hypothetical protein
MEAYQVIEREEGIQASIWKQLGKSGVFPSGSVPQAHPALLVISPEAARQKLALPRACRTVLLPGDAGALLDGMRTASVVSYGASPRDSLTISSREGGRVWAALQRELVTVDGRVVERQEFPLLVPQKENTLSALAVAGALLLLGMPPELLEITN